MVFSITWVQLSVAGGPLRIMNHYLGHVIKWGKYVIIECDCQFSGALQSPGNWTASQEERDDMGREAEMPWYVSSFLLPALTVMRHFLIALGVFEDNHQVTGHCQNYKVCLCWIPRSWQCGEMGFNLGLRLPRPENRPRNTPSFGKELPGHPVCFCDTVPVLRDFFS